LVPSGADLAASWRDGRAQITAVRPRTPTARSGIRAGDVVEAINDVPIGTAMRAANPACVEADAGSIAPHWALQRVLAGRHADARKLTLVREDGARFSVWLPKPMIDENKPRAKRLRDGTAVIPISNLGDAKTVAQFDAQLQRYQDAPALLIDLRETATGGNTDVAEPILARFIERAAAYQRVEPRNASAYDRTIAPRGPFTFTKPIAVIVGPWTASMGEGMAIGLNALRGAPVVGAPMAKLRGAVQTFTLPASGWRFTIPTEKLLHIDGTPREAFAPMAAGKNDYGTDTVFVTARQALSQR
jgi:C-terminal processing protease CtpA/Prc